MRAVLRRTAVLPSLVRRRAVDPPPPRGSQETAEKWDTPGTARRLGRKILLWFLGAVALLGLAALALGAWEIQTSFLQSRWFSPYAARLTWEIRDGATATPLQAPRGPYDWRHGYARLGDMQARLESAGFRVVRQAHPSPELLAIAGKGIPPPYREKSGPAIEILDANGRSLYSAARGHNQFRDFVDVPPLVVRSLLYVENRQLLDEARPQLNPALDWDRLVLSGWRYLQDKLFGSGSLSGGSTLATQVQKFRHSPNGRTTGVQDKLHQMIAASLSAYRDGPDSRAARRRVVVDYLNGMPLGAARRVGEVSGLGEGMWVFFGKTLEQLVVDLSLPEDGEALERKAETFKQALALLLATRRPALYLGREREALETRLEFYSRELARQGIISFELEAATRRVPLRQLEAPPAAPAPRFVERKAANAIRTELLRLLGVDKLYELDQLDLRVETTLDGPAQAAVLAVLQRLKDRAFLAENGFYGERLLSTGDAAQVIYSFTLYEADATGSRLQVQADNFERPFDLNEGAKLELGSTAKLRTLAHYLQVIAGLHERHEDQPSAELWRTGARALDPLTRWAAVYMALHPEAPLADMLSASLERTYSADPDATFYTGGGIHNFANFDDETTGEVSLRLALRHSVNLAFIRLMRDLVQYHVAELGYDERTILRDADHPQRRPLLEAAVDRESREHLRNAFGKYRGLSPEAAVRELCGMGERALERFAVFFMGGKPDASAGELEEAAQRFFPERAAEIRARAKGLHASCGSSPFSLNDQAWLMRRNPMEVWLVRDRQTQPGAGWSDLVERSAAARLEAHEWLLGRHVVQAQNLRITAQLERLAFERIHASWRQLGYPFASLVPSLATAIGSSADRPAALAELVGILQNDGLRAPSLRIEALHFGEGTPYETHFEVAPEATERVMPVEVARLLRELLIDAVENGTGRRARGALRLTQGQTIAVGGKTGSGDNRFEKFTAQGELVSSRPINRTASFVFLAGDKHFGVVTAQVLGEDSGHFSFSSALALQTFKTLAPAVAPLVARAQEATGTEQSEIPGVQWAPVATTQARASP